MALVGSLVIGLQARTEQLEKDLAKARAEIKSVGKTVEETKPKLASLGTAFVGLAGGILSVQAAVRTLASLADVGLRVTNLERSFTALAGSADAGRRQLEFARATANALGKDLETTATSYRAFFAASKGQLDTGTIQGLFTNIQKLAGQTGASTEETNRALIAITQSLGKGKFAAEEYTGQLLEALPILGEKFPQALGVTREQMGKLIEKGLDSKTAFMQLNAFLAKDLPPGLEVANKHLVLIKNTLFEIAASAGKSVLTFFDDMAAKALAAAQATL